MKKKTLLLALLIITALSTGFNSNVSAAEYTPQGDCYCDADYVLPQDEFEALVEAFDYADSDRERNRYLSDASEHFLMLTEHLEVLFRMYDRDSGRLAAGKILVGKILDDGSASKLLSTMQNGRDQRKLAELLKHGHPLCRFMIDLEEVYSDRQRIEMLTSVLKQREFSKSDIQQIVSILDRDNARTDAILLFIKKDMVDMEDLRALSRLMDTSSGRTELRKVFEEAFFLEMLILDLEDASYDSDRNEILLEKSRSHKFLVDEILEILETFDYDSDKISAIRILKRSIRDSENREDLVEVFYSSSDRRKVRKILDL